jgi:hypothetical protein
LEFPQFGVTRQPVANEQDVRAYARKPGQLVAQSRDEWFG